MKLRAVVKKTTKILSARMLRFSWSLLLVPFVSPAFAQKPASVDSALLDAAKREGKVVWYTITRTETAEALRKRFESQFPPVKMLYLRTRSDDIGNRLLAEAKSGRNEADIASTNTAMAYTLKKAGVLAKYSLTNARSLHSVFKDPHGYWYANNYVARGMGYNTRQVKALPTSLDELALPAWKEKLALDTEDSDWLAVQLRRYGKKRGLDLVKRISPNIVFRKGHTLGLQLVAAGEFTVHLTASADTVHEMKTKGAPIDIMLGSPAWVQVRPIVLAANSQRQNAARLFMEWLFSKETAEFVAKQEGRSPTHPEVKSPIPALSGVTDYIALNDDEYYQSLGEYDRLFAEIFNKRP
jgi:ABC-type Fe3+ transport system substrate-binding protein